MKYKKAINSFWEKHQKAFDSSSDNMEKEWEECVEICGMIENYNVDDIVRRINAAREIKFLQISRCKVLVYLFFQWNIDSLFKHLGGAQKAITELINANHVMDALIICKE